MARIKVNAEAPLYNGMPVTFRAPCNCSIVDGLTVCYGDASQQFAFSDAHGNNLAGLGNLFAKDAVVKAVLDTEKGRAFLQNADTNAYIEERLSKFVSSVNGQRGDVIITAQRIGAAGCEQREIDVTYEHNKGSDDTPNWEILDTTKGTLYLSGNHFVVKANPCLQKGNMSYRINMSALPDGSVILGMVNHPANNPKYTLMGSYMEDKAVRLYENGNYATPTLYFWGVIEGEGSGSGGGGADEPDWVQALIDMATDAKETAEEALGAVDGAEAKADAALSQSAQALNASEDALNIANAARQDVSDLGFVDGVLPITKGGTGQVTEFRAARALGRTNYNCTSAANASVMTVNISNFPATYGCALYLHVWNGNTVPNVQLSVNGVQAPIYTKDNKALSGTEIGKNQVCEFTLAEAANGLPRRWILINPLTESGGGNNEELEQDVEKLKGDVAALQGDVADIGVIKEDIEALQGDVTNLKKTDTWEIIEKICFGYELLNEKPDDWDENKTTKYYYAATDNSCKMYNCHSWDTWETNQYWRYTGEYDTQIQRIEKSKAPDGTPYNFKAVSVFGHIYNTTASGLWCFNAYLSESDMKNQMNGISGVATLAKLSNATYPYHFNYRVTPDNGVYTLTCFSGQQGNFTSVTGASNAAPNIMMKPITSGNIKGISFHIYSAKEYYSEGDYIEIWGVRADG